MGVSIWWQHFYFGVNYPFKLFICNKYYSLYKNVRFSDFQNRQIKLIKTWLDKVN